MDVIKLDNFSELIIPKTEETTFLYSLNYKPFKSVLYVIFCGLWRRHLAKLIFSPNKDYQ